MKTQSGHLLALSGGDSSLSVCQAAGSAISLRLSGQVCWADSDTVCISLYRVILWKRWCTQSCGTSFTRAKQNVSLGTNGTSTSLACLSRNSMALVRLLFAGSFILAKMRKEKR